MFLFNEKGTCGFTQVPIYLRDAIAKHGTRSTEREVRNAKHGTRSTLLLVFRVFLLDSPAHGIDFLVGEVLIVGAFIIVEG